jgi:hypothetical protein
MLVIRDEQMETFWRERQALLVDHVALMLRDEAPEVVTGASEDEIRAFVRKGCERARAYGISETYLMGQYVLFMAWAGEDLDEQAWAAEILRDPALSALAKIVELEDHILSNASEE